MLTRATTLADIKARLRSNSELLEASSTRIAANGKAGVTTTVRFNRALRQR